MLCNTVNTISIFACQSIKCTGIIEFHTLTHQILRGRIAPFSLLTTKRTGHIGILGIDIGVMEAAVAEEFTAAGLIHDATAVEWQGLGGSANNFVSCNSNAIVWQSILCFGQ